MKVLKMKARQLVAVGVAIGLSGCAATPAHISASFDAKQAQAMLVPGGNAIRGSALIRQQGGGVVTCAGREVRLIPATAYARERMNLLYGSTTRGYNPAFMGRNLGEQAQNKEYLDATRRTTCDAQGFFRFDNVADGDFFVATAIVWQVRPYVSEGGALMHAVTLSGKEAKEIVLSPQ